MGLADLKPDLDPGVDYGEVFTRRWVVDLILDLAGYTSDKDLGEITLVEPSCGTGAFLVPVVERLVESARTHGRELESLGPAIRGFDLLRANANRARKAVAQILISNGVDPLRAELLAEEWVSSGDFLLQCHEPGSADFVVGNPPYIRLENVSSAVMDTYRRVCPTMRGRADIYVGFIERGLELLKSGGVLSFICADRWMRNQYGADLRELITSSYAVDAVISMHDVDAFEDEVSAYPAVVVLRNGSQGRAAVVDADEGFSEAHARKVSSWINRGRKPSLNGHSFEATRVDQWFKGRDLWPAGSPSNLALLAELESRFPLLEDPATGTSVGIGLASGCDDVYLTTDTGSAEADRMLPMLQAADITSGSIDWSGTYLVNPWADNGALVDLGDYPRLNDYFRAHETRIRGRFVARRNPRSWYRTIDKVNHGLTNRPKLLIPDLKATAHPVLDEGGFYPHHNLYFVVSDSWDLEALGGLLLSDYSNLFVGAYCVKMRGGCYRFQAQYLRRIRIPDPAGLKPAERSALAAAFRERDCERATGVASKIYGAKPPTGV